MKSISTIPPVQEGNERGRLSEESTTRNAAQDVAQDVAAATPTIAGQAEAAAAHGVFKKTPRSRSSCQIEFQVSSMDKFNPGSGSGGIC